MMYTVGLTNADVKFLIVQNTPLHLLSLVHTTQKNIIDAYTYPKLFKLCLEIIKSHFKWETYLAKKPLKHCRYFSRIEGYTWKRTYASGESSLMIAYVTVLSCMLS